MECPACGAANVTNEHLIREYLDLTIPAMSGLFRENARKCRNEIADVLVSRGVTEIPNSFGAIPVKRMEWMPTVYRSQIS